MVKVTIDLSIFNKGLAAIRQATKRDGAEIVNRALKNVAFRAAEYTPFRSPADIQQELLDNKTALRIVTSRLRKTIGTTRITRRGKTRVVSRITRKQIGAAVTKLIAKRKAGSRASRAGWFPAVKAFGGSIRGGKLKPGGAASRGYGRRATPEKLIGEIANAYYGILKGPAQSANAAVMRSALQRAVNTVGRENIAYAKKKIEATLRRHSD
jgi:hypothetical protein